MLTATSSYLRPSTIVLKNATASFLVFRVRFSSVDGVRVADEDEMVGMVGA